MENLVLYRKYRPKVFKEMVGQEHVIRTLSNALATDKLAHAYIFSGSRGTGKTSVARLLAKAANCEKRTGCEPCNKCSNCQAINRGSSLDLIEIDAASNRGIDEIRELRDGIKFSPSELKYKVFIIDEVHQLTPAAFNALLKTLEEPPAHAIFILATTEIHKVLQTIISRCQRFDFHKLSLDKIVGRLAWIAKREKVAIEKPALELIASSADGAIRDGESLLGQVMSMEDKHITLDEVRAILGVTDITAVRDLVGYLINKNNSQAISHINQVYSQGYDLIHFTKSLIGYLRKMMILKVDINLAQLIAVGLTEEQSNVIVQQGEKLTQNELVKFISLFLEAENEIKSADFPQLPLELAIVKYCQAN